MDSADPSFSGSIPEVYQNLMVPMLFEPYALDLADRAVALAPASVLELAAGTGVVTRQLARILPVDVTITATDLSPGMVDEAASKSVDRPVRWAVADAMSLPFADASFDLVLCQFGVMFFSDKPAAFAEMRRVLRPGGSAIFTVWDGFDDNEFVAVVDAALSDFFPENPPSFMADLPHGYHDPELIRHDLALGGFETDVRIETVTRQSSSAGAGAAAIAYCQGNPMRLEIERLGSIEAATEHVASALAARFGNGPIRGRIQAQVVTAVR